MRGYMPFPNAELRIPIEYQEKMEAYTRTRPTGGSAPEPEDAPFPRQVDVWFLAVCLGVVHNRRVELQPSQAHKFNTASMLESDPDRIEMLELIAIALTDDPYVIREPRRVIDIANELAAGGLPIVFTMLEEGNSRRIDNLSDKVQAMLIEVLPPPQPELVEA